MAAIVTSISKKHIRPGGMAPSEWTRSIRGVRDTPVEDYSTPGFNAAHRIAYLPPHSVLPYLLARSVSYVKQTLWRCSQLWPYFWMCSLSTGFKISPRVPSTFSPRRVGRRCEDMILPGREDPRDCVDPRNLGKTNWDHKLGKKECVFSLYNKMRWKWDAV
jgi:hypothetical protein